MSLKVGEVIMPEEFPADFDYVGNVKKILEGMEWVFDYLNENDIENFIEEFKNDEVFEVDDEEIKLGKCMGRFRYGIGEKAALKAQEIGDESCTRRMTEVIRDTTIIYPIPQGNIIEQEESEEESEDEDFDYGMNIKI